MNPISLLSVAPSAPLTDVMRVQSEGKSHGLPAGIALVVDEAGVLLGTLTDGDVRRALLKSGSLDVTAESAMTANPVVFDARLSFSDILAALPAELERRGRAAQRFLGKIVLVDEARHPVRVLDYHQLWEQRVATHRHVVVLGMGYVGLTLALVLADRGIRVTGVDTDPEKVAGLAKGQSHVHELGLVELLREQLDRQFKVSTEIPDDGDVFIISVGTPVTAVDGARPQPIMHMVEAATRAVGQKMKTGGLVVLRSTVPVGCCRETVIPILEKETGGNAGVDFHVSFAPERTVEGKALSELRSLPQVIGGINEDSVEATVALFRELTSTIVRVGSLEAAEFVKLINNSFRDLIFSFSNEMSQLASAFNVDINEVIGAANRGYPRDPIPLPSPGVGGPCLTKDPYILGHVAQRFGKQETLSIRGREVNESMHAFVADAVEKALMARGDGPAKILLCGLAFKGRPETGDLRNSSSVEIAQLLRAKGFDLYGHDAVASADEISAIDLKPVSLPDGFKGMDAVLFLNNHRAYTNVDVFEMVRAMSARPVLYDGWHTFREHDVLGVRPSQYLTLGYRASSDAQSDVKWSRS